MKRITSIDITRGLVMVIMALDHTRDLMHSMSITQSPTNLATTSPALFFTRWITHLCAPTFVFLSGVSAYISFRNKNNFEESRKFLLTRGIWLIVLEFTLVNFGVWFDIHFTIFLFDVIATIGFGFIILGLLLKAQPRTIGIIGIVIILCHNLFAMIPFSGNSTAKTILTPFFLPTVYPLGLGRSFVMAYPPIPWLGIMLVGFASGKFFYLSSENRKKLFLKIGLSSWALFIILRFVNIYGDSFPWSTQKNSLFTFLSFINVTKYPPSLLFDLLTLGSTFLLLSLFDNIDNVYTKKLVIFGRVPLFYFIVHWYIIHPLMFAMVFLQGFHSSDFVFGFNFGRPMQGSGVGLVAIYIIWIAVVIVLYPICKWYGNYKEQHRDNKWLSYL